MRFNIGDQVIIKELNELSWIPEWRKWYNKTAQSDKKNNKNINETDIWHSLIGCLCVVKDICENSKSTGVIPYYLLKPLKNISKVENDDENDEHPLYMFYEFEVESPIKKKLSLL